jgi:hypothetical protein
MTRHKSLLKKKSQRMSSIYCELSVAVATCLSCKNLGHWWWSGGGSLVGTCFLPLHPGLNLTVHVCHPVVPYMLTGFAICSVDREISRGARKLVRTST